METIWSNLIIDVNSNTFSLIICYPFDLTSQIDFTISVLLQVNCGKLIRNTSRLFFDAAIKRILMDF